MRRARLAGRNRERIGERGAQRRVSWSPRVLNQKRERLCLLISGRERRDALRRDGEEFVIVDHDAHPTSLIARA